MIIYLETSAQIFWKTKQSWLLESVLLMIVYESFLSEVLSVLSSNSWIGFVLSLKLRLKSGSAFGLYQTICFLQCRSTLYTYFLEAINDGAITTDSIILFHKCVTVNCEALVCFLVLWWAFVLYVLSIDVFLMPLFYFQDVSYFFILFPKDYLVYCVSVISPQCSVYYFIVMESKRKWKGRSAIGRKC